MSNVHFRQRQVLLHEVQVPCHCDGHDREELFPGEQWYNMPEEAQEGQEGSEGQEEQEGETRAEREMREDLLRITEEYGAPGGEEGTQRTAVAGRPRVAQMARGGLAVVRGGLTAEEGKRADLILISRRQPHAGTGLKRTGMQYRERAAVGLEAAKRASMGRKEGGGRAAGATSQRSGRAKMTLPGPPYVCTMLGRGWRHWDRQLWHRWQTRDMRYRWQRIERMRRIGLQWWGRGGTRQQRRGAILQK